MRRLESFVWRIFLQNVLGCLRTLNRAQILATVILIRRILHVSADSQLLALDQLPHQRRLPGSGRHPDRGGRSQIRRETRALRPRRLPLLAKAHVDPSQKVAYLVRELFKTCGSPVTIPPQNNERTQDVPLLQDALRRQYPDHTAQPAEKACFPCCYRETG